MLIGIKPQMTPELLYVLAQMGHGDEIVVADTNFPAVSTAQHCVMPDVISLPGLNAVAAVDLICSVMPIDSFTDAGAYRMQVDGKPDDLAPAHAEVFAALERVKPKDANLASLERMDFYARAKQAFAVVHTGEERGYSCFILRKGVVF